ncbi:hypothetical protein MMC22_007483 [Lobaria immixta]|nr:hypothetical protein [Lobaria immixta]
MSAETASSAEENEPFVVATCQQTRFHLAQGSSDVCPYAIVVSLIALLLLAKIAIAVSQVSIKGLNVAIVPSRAASKTKKSKAKAAVHELEILTNAELKLKPGVHYGLLGRNGTGKSILSSGADDKEDERAQIRRYRQLRHNRLRIQLLEVQNNASLKSGARGIQARKELIEFEKEVAESQEMIDQFDEDLESPKIQEELKAASELLVDLQTQMECISLVDLETRARSILRGLGFAEATLQKPFITLSGGWRMRCMLACVLLQSTDIMILDEPTNFLDLLGIIWLQEHLIGLRTTEKKTLIIVSHDRDFVDHICEGIILLKDKSLVYFPGNLSAYEEDLRSRILYLTRMQEVQDRETARIEKTISASIKLGKKTGDDNKLRMAKSHQKKLEDHAGMQVGASGGRFKLSRDRMGWNDTKLAAIEIPKTEQSISMTLFDPPDLRFPGPLVSLEDIHYRYTSKGELILRGLGLNIHMGDRVGVVGLNGCGKSTLIKVVTEALSPVKGIVTRHPRLRMGFYSQHAIEELQSLGGDDPSRTALNILAGDAGDEMTEQELRGFLGSLGLPGRTASDVPVAKLSGGQLVRLALARILWNRPNLLVLDEVTTHLDFHTVVALAEALSDFSGAVLLVTHDRFLVRRVIEGERPDDAEDDRKDPDETLQGSGLEHMKSVYALKNGKLELLPGGMMEFERSLEKRVAKMMAK